MTTKPALPDNILDLLSGDFSKRLSCMIRAIVEYNVQNADIESLKDYARSDLTRYYEGDGVHLREIEKEFSEIYGDILNG